MDGDMSSFSSPGSRVSSYKTNGSNTTGTFDSPTNGGSNHGSPNVVSRKAGWMDKEKDRGLFTKGWNKRWFSLSAFGLSYYDKESDALPKKTINFASIKQVIRKEGDTTLTLATNIFQHDGKPRKFNLRAATEGEANEWADAIKVNVKNFADAQKKAVEAHYMSMESEEGSDGESMTGGERRRSIEGNIGLMQPPRRMSVEGSAVSPSTRRRGSMGSIGADMMRRFTKRGSVGEQGKGANVGASMVKSLVSKQKKRFVEGDFDLDLSYITPRIIAMGFPSEGLESVYRNPYTEVYRFLETFHSDAYKVYNLCSERSYDPSKFHDRVECFPFDDHNAPPFEVIRPFCINVDDWLAADPRNIAAVHCKAGKGRTGCLIVCWLLHSGICATADEAMTYYANERTFNGKGVTIPSQIRYCRYFEANLGQTRPLAPLAMQSVTVHAAPPHTGQLVARINNGQSSFLVASPNVDTKGRRRSFADAYDGPPEPTQEVEIEAGGRVVTGDVHVTLLEKKKGWGRHSETEDKVCAFWFHTSFVDDHRLLLVRKELDGAVKKDKKMEKFCADFSVEVTFGPSEAVAFRVHEANSGIGGGMSTASHSVTSSAFGAAVQQEMRRATRPPGLDAGALFRAPSGAAVNVHSPSHINKLPSAATATSTDSEAVLEDIEEGEEECTTAIMIYDWMPPEDDASQGADNPRKHLRLRANDFVHVLDKHDKGWWLGKFGDEVGWFPSRYCVEVTAASPMPGGAAGVPLAI